MNSNDFKSNGFQPNGSQPNGLQFSLKPARKCFWGYTIVKMYTLPGQTDGKAVVVYLTTIV